MHPPPEIPPEAIVRARSGDSADFRRLVESLSALTYNLAWRITGGAADAEDLSQEVFLKLHRNFAAYDPRLPFLPWFRKLTTNVCLNWLRARNARRERPLGEGDVAAPEAVRPEEPSAVLRRAMDALPPEYRLVLARFYLEQLSVAEIAAAMEVPSGTIKTWLFRAREELKNRLLPHVEHLF
jgi:RNA polymerase sigma-70 factor (ECF subfamily)